MSSIETIGKRWVHPTTGEVRYYVNDAWRYAGPECSHYNTGNISYATLDGEKISNCKAREYCGCISKCWITEDGKVHVKYWGCEDFVEAVRVGIEAKLKEE